MDATRKHERVIVTAASPSYEASALALIGSLNCNWPGHPPVVVYDLGMTDDTLSRLAAAASVCSPSIGLRQSRMLREARARE